MKKNTSIGFKDLFCSKPFNSIEIDQNGDVWVCCGDWLPTPIGNLTGSTLMEVWNSDMAQKIRRSIFDGTFAYCDKKTCPDLVKMSLPLRRNLKDNPYFSRIFEHQMTILEKGPYVVDLGYDQTCNLRCITCRPKVISYQGDQFNKAKLFQKKYLAEGLENTKTLIITGYGDPFASRLYRTLLRSLSSEDYPKLQIFLLTNGLLFTPEMWASMKSIQPAILGLSVSVDATNDSTYRSIRGGNFQKLYQNLEFMSELLANKKIEGLQLSFVVQAGNYREMKDFVQLGVSLNCTEVLFQRLIHWKSTMTNERFSQLAVHQKHHPNYYEFCNILNDPIFNHPKVDMSNLKGLM